MAKDSGRRKIDIGAIHEDDAVPALEALGIKEAIDAGRLACSLCGEMLELDRIGAVRKGKNGELVMACTRLDCIRSLSGEAP